MLARALRSLGHRAPSAWSSCSDDVDDDRARGAASSRESHDWLFTSGGVGPTHDDVTVEAVARAFGVRVVSSPEMEQMLRAHYRERCTEGHLRWRWCPRARRSRRTTAITWPTIRMATRGCLPGDARGVPDEAAGRRRARWPAERSASCRDAVYVSSTRASQAAARPGRRACSRTSGSARTRSGMDPDLQDEGHVRRPRRGRVLAARDAFVALLPAGEPQRVE